MFRLQCQTDASPQEPRSVNERQRSTGENEIADSSLNTPTNTVALAAACGPGRGRRRRYMQIRRTAAEPAAAEMGPIAPSSARAAPRRPKRRCGRRSRPTRPSSYVLQRRQRFIRLQKAEKPRLRSQTDEGPRATVEMTVTTEVRYCKDRYVTLP